MFEIPPHCLHHLSVSEGWMVTHRLRLHCIFETARPLTAILPRKSRQRQRKLRHDVRSSLPLFHHECCLAMPAESLDGSSISIRRITDSSVDRLIVINRVKSESCSITAISHPPRNMVLRYMWTVSIIWFVVEHEYYHWHQVRRVAEGLSLVGNPWSSWYG